MKSALLAALVVAACGGSDGPKEVSCDEIVKDPGSALGKLGEAETDGARVFAKLEACFAPGGDTCERAAVGGRMMPSQGPAMLDRAASRSDAEGRSMAVSDGGDVAARDASWKQFTADCRTLPAADQQCLLLSYGIAHPACSAVQDKFRRAHR